MHIVRLSGTGKSDRLLTGAHHSQLTAIGSFESVKKTPRIHTFLSGYLQLCYLHPLVSSGYIQSAMVYSHMPELKKRSREKAGILPSAA